MSNKTRSILKGIAVVLVLLAVLMELKIIIIPALVVYKLWIVVLAFSGSVTVSELIEFRLLKRK